MSDTLQELKDDRDIRSLFFRYCRGIDRADEDMVRSVYLTDSYDDHGAFKGTGQEFATYAVQKLLKEYVATMHALHNCDIEVDGDTATAETYFVAYHLAPQPDGGQHLLVFGGRYLDRLGRENGHWGIGYRRVVHDWTITLPGHAWSTERLAPFTLAGRGDRSDPVYELLSSTSSV